MPLFTWYFTLMIFFRSLFFLVPANAMLGDVCAVDVERGAHRNGVQVRRLADVLREPCRARALVRLCANPWTVNVDAGAAARDPHRRPVIMMPLHQRRAEIRAAFRAFFRRARDAAYDFNPFHLLGAASLGVARSLRCAGLVIVRRPESFLCCLQCDIYVLSLQVLWSS